MVKKGNIKLSNAIFEDEDTASKILRCALREFALHSINGVSTREIAKEAGVNHACINYYFGGKWEMYMEIIRRGVASFKQNYGKILKEIDDFSKSQNPQASKAIEYTKKLFRMSRDSMKAPEFESFQLLIRREEVYPTEAFTELYNGAFKPLIYAVSSLVIIAKKGSITNVNAVVMASSLLSLNISPVLCKSGVLRILKAKEFNDEMFDDYSAMIDLTIEKVLK